MPVKIQPCPDDAHLVHIKVHEKNSVPQYLELVEPGGTLDDYLPPHNSWAIQIRATAQNIGAQGICQKNGSLFAMFANASDVSKQIYGTKIELVDRMRALWDQTLKYMHGEVDVETYIADTEHVAIVDQNEVSKTLIQELQYGSLKSEEDHTHPLFSAYLYAGASLKSQRNLLFSEIELSPNNPYSWADLARTYFYTGKLTQAIIASKWVVKLNPEDPRSWQLLADILDVYYRAAPEERAHVREEADRVGARQVELSNDFDNMFRLGQTLLDSGINGHAVTALERAVEIRARQNTGLGKEGGKALGLLGVAYNRIEHHEKAVDALRRFSEFYQSDSSWFPQHLSSSLMKLGRWAEAEQAIEEALKLDPDWAPFWEALGIARYHRYKFEEAKEAFETAMEKDRENDADARKWLLKTKLKLYSTQLDKNPLTPEEIFSLVDFDQPTEAVELLRQALEFYPEQPELWKSLGATLHHLDETREAITAFKKAVELDPKDTDAQAQLITAMYELYSKEPEENPGVLEDIFAILTRVAVQDPDTEDTDLIRAVGKSALLLKKYEIAIFYMAKAAHLDPTNNDNWWNLAALYQRTGRPGEELHALEQMLANGVDEKVAEKIEGRIRDLKGSSDKTDPEDPEGSSTPPDMPGVPDASSSSGGGDQFMKSEWKGQTMADVGGFDPSEQDLFSTTFTESATLLYSATNTTDPNVGIQIMQGAGATTLGLPTWFTIPLAARPAGVYAR